MSKKLTTEEFIESAKLIHGDKYNYSKVIYKGLRYKILIYCKEHGLFELETRFHLRGSGCPLCRKKNMKYNIDINEKLIHFGKAYIYRIKSPSGKIYVGQTTNLCKRKSYYKNLVCKTQTKIYLSLLKYGWEQHVFEIVEEIENYTTETLNEREIYWKQYYLDLVDNNWSQVLFCQLHDGVVDKKKIIEYSLNKCGENNSMYGKQHSIKTKEKISKANKGKKRSEEDKMKMKEHNSGVNNPMYGKKHSEETLEKIREKAIGRKYSEESKLKMSEDRKGEKSSMYGRKGELSPNYGKKHSEETKLKMRKKAIGRKLSDNQIEKMSHKIIIDGIEYPSMSEASRMLNICTKTISNRANNPKFTNYQFI